METSLSPTVHQGLEGVLVARTRISEVDGERGQLTIAGHTLESVAGALPFEGVCVLLRDGCWPTAEQISTLRAELGRARARAHARLSQTQGLLRLPDAMDSLRATVAALPGDAGALDVLGTLAVATAAWGRNAERLEPVAPDSERPHAEDFLRMLHGREPSVRAVDGLNAYLVTVAEHGLNASTFAVRVVASTGSDFVSAATAGIGALKGPLHGGAPGPVLDMLDAIGTPAAVRPWLEQALARKQRIMGMGHRIYRVRDPRAEVLEREVTRLAPSERLSLARLAERTAAELLAERYPQRRLCANVEFYTAVLLEALSVPRALFSAVFAMARAAGWAAHDAEQRREGRLIRPSALYVGPRAGDRASRGTAALL